MVKNAMLAKEMLISVVNKIGVLADISEILADHGINIQAVAGYSVNKEAKIMLATEDNLRAKEALEKKGYRFIVENEIIMLDLENKPGALKSLTYKLAGEDIDIKYIYGSTCSAGCPGKIALSTSDNERALVALKTK